MELVDKFEISDLYQIKDLGEILRLQVEKRAQDPAIFCEDRVLSYADLRRNSIAVASYITSLPSEENQRVGFIGREYEAYYEVLFGCAQAGAIFVPINWRLTSPEIAHILTNANITVLFCDAAILQIVEDSLCASGHHAEVICLNSKGITLIDYGSVLRTDPSKQPLPSPDPERLFCLIYTSGTTGLPKGVCLTHKAFFQIREAMITHGIRWLDWYSDDRSLVGIPGFHIGGLWWALQSFSSGAAIVILPQFEPRAFVDAMSRHNVSIACMVPAMINLLLDVIEEDAICLPKLRKIVYGGAPISAALLQRGLDMLSCDFAQIYGLSETCNTAVCLDPDSHRISQNLLLSAGRPYPCVSLKIMGADGQALPSGEIGEICIKTSAQMSEYWGLPDATALILHDGWIYTGDAGYLDEEGYLFIYDRLKDVIITGGEKIFPAEVENIIAGFPPVHECAVIGIPDENWGELAICFLVTRPKTSLNITEFYRYLETRLASYKRPAQIYCIDSLPRNPSGKLLRRELRDAFWFDQKRRV